MNNKRIDYEQSCHIESSKYAMTGTGAIRDTPAFTTQAYNVQTHYLEAPMVQWLCHSPCKLGVAGLIPGFSSPSDGTINRGPVSI